jgi:hypothetical protein
MKSHDEMITRLRMRLAFYILLKQALVLATLWGFLWGTGVLVLRGAFRVSYLPLLWGLSGLLVVFGLAIVLARRGIPSATAVRSLLDKGSGCGGLFMAAEEVDIGDWQARIPSLVMPSLRWRNPRCCGLFAAAVAFVLVSFLVPQRFASLGSPHGLEIGKEINRLAAQIETMKEEEIIDSAKAKSLQEKLEQIRKEASGEDPVKTWEALDHLENSSSKAAQEAAEKALAQTECLTKAETLAEGLAEGSAEPQVTTEGMKELAGMIGKAAAENDLLSDALSSDILDACKDGSFSAEELQGILRALRLCKGDIAECLGRLCRAGLIDPNAIHLCESLGKCNGEGLIAFLNENMGKGSLSELLDVWCGAPGRGGVDRGRGDAPMAWSDGTSEEGAKFKEQVLPPASLAALKESKLLGVSAAAPSVENAGQVSVSGALEDASAGGGSAHTYTILPRHRGPVKRYFERK